MLYNYIALAFFAAAAILVSTILILASKSIGKKEPDDPVKNAPYESGDESVGSARGAANRYLPFFSLFLPFEVVAATILALGAYSIFYRVDVGIVVLGGRVGASRDVRVQEVG
jgi:NADH:ubiquinone oxidoreductase subunit 3 (subunit A)